MKRQTTEYFCNYCGDKIVGDTFGVVVTVVPRPSYRGTEERPLAYLWEDGHVHFHNMCWDKIINGHNAKK